MKLLLEHGALVDLPSNDGVTPLMAAAGVEYGLRVTRGRNRTEDGVLETMQLLLDAGADINARSLVEPAQRRTAVRGRQQRGARGRLTRSTVAAVRCRAGAPCRTELAIHGASLRGFTYIVEFLAANGADLTAKDANGRTPLDLASGNYSEDFLRQAAEPHVETAKLLESLIAARSTTSPVSGVAHVSPEDVAE